MQQWLRVPVQSQLQMVDLFLLDEDNSYECESLTRKLHHSITNLYANKHVINLLVLRMTSKACLQCHLYLDLPHFQCRRKPPQLSK